MSTEPPTITDAEAAARQLLAQIRALLDSAGGDRGRVPEVGLDSRLEQDLGLDSLGRSELFSRLERHFGLRLSERALLCETPRELLQAVLHAGGAPTAGPLRGIELDTADADVPVHASTLPEALRWHVDAHPKRTHVLLYVNDAEQPEPLSYADLWQGAAACAAALVQRGLRPGERVALMLPTGKDYLFAFFGSLLAGGVPVPIYPPTRPSQLEEHLLRHAGILDNAGVRVLITVPEGRAVARLLQLRVTSLNHVLTPGDLTEGPVEDGLPPGAADDLAFLQYTSGSTGSPKGVMLTHAHLLANIRAMGQAAQLEPDDRFVSWLPLYHDMGLIGAWLGSLYFGLPLILMSPLRFLSRPLSWLQAIQRHRGTLSAAPNFGYELCLNKVSDADLADLDLSSWRRAFNGAEPVSPDTLRRFSERFAPCGLRPRALAPVYGLAEAAVGLAFPPADRGPLLDPVLRDTLRRRGRAEPVPFDHPDCLAVPACGRPLPGYRVRVVDAAGRELPQRREGRLQFQGPSATGGYFRNPEATAALFDGPWLNTGDRAYLADGDIYLTGRSKEMIIRGGRNLYPYEVEQAVGELAGIRKGCVAVFAAADQRSGTERLVVLAETRERDPTALDDLRGRVRQCAGDRLGGPPDTVLLLPPHGVLKTSSGKLRRAAMQDLFERGLIGHGSAPVWLQLLRVAGLGLAGRLRHGWRRGVSLLWAGWAWSVFAGLVPGVWLGVLLWPRRGGRWALIRGAIRALRGLTGVPLWVEGAERLPPPSEPLVLVANHASYLDTLVVIDALSRDFVYVAKREFLGHWYTRLFLQRLGTLFVERFDLRRGIEHRHEFGPRLQAGESLAFYPEGTFRDEPGLLPFRMGAFVAAAEAGVAVLPVTLLGTRDMLRGESRVPRHGRLGLVVHRPVRPDGADWDAAVRLRDAARTAIADALERGEGVPPP